MVIVAILATSCTFDSQGPLAPDSTLDGGRDATVISPDALVPIDGGCTGFSAVHVPDSCALGPPGGALVLDEAGVYDYDTDTGLLTPPAGAAFSLVTTDIDGVSAAWVTNLEISSGSTLLAHGQSPLFIASDGSIVVQGRISVRSAGAFVAAGANPTACPILAAGENDQGGGGGGGGGGFGAAGATGSDGDSNDNNADGTSSGGAGGSAVGVPNVIRGGCPGARGGNGLTAGAGDGGAGGGAVQLTARNEIDVSGGTVEAGGAGGKLATDSSISAGGGGGSGGYIGIDAPTRTFDDNTVLAANGGGGGAGIGNAGGGSEDGTSGLAMAAAAAGGTAGAGGGNGGGGGFRDSADGGAPAAPPVGGGGGGGGGAGYVVVFGNALPASGTLSPDGTLVTP